MSVRMRVSGLALIASAVLLTAGCGSGMGGDDGGADVASVHKKDGGATPPAADRQKTYRQYASCLREKGVTGVTVSDEGVGMAGQGASKDDGSGTSNGDDIQKAMTECNKKVPGMQQLNSQRDEEAVAGSRKFAACARKNGIPAMADPAVVNGAPQMKIPDVAPEIWQKVLEKCRKHMDGGMALTGGDQ
ncbi:hypothetical protein O3S80_03450 [Streptomyces sp. Lzd4kr]|nr:hypothetical protein [Streptomyces sp. Lzd4kr]